MSDEQKMPDVIYARPAGKWVRLVVAPDDDDTPYLRCPDNIDPDDAVVVKRVAVEKMRVGILEKGTTIATLTAERDELVEAIDAFNHIDRSGRHDTADLEQLNDAVEKCLRLINE